MDSYWANIKMRCHEHGKSLVPLWKGLICPNKSDTMLENIKDYIFNTHQDSAWSKTSPLLFAGAL